MTNFTITTDNKNGVHIIRTNGYLDEQGGAKVFDAVQKAIDTNQNFILDLHHSPVINSQGIAQIIELCEIIVDEKNGQIGFVGLSELTSGVFKMVGLLQMGDSYPDQESAIAEMTG